MSYEPKYWNGKGKLQAVYDKLKKLIPQEGGCPDPKGRNAHLERLRVAANCYYDLYNNGLCNRRIAAKQMFGLVPVQAKGQKRDWALAQYDDLMDTFIQIAAEEQGLFPTDKEANRLVKLLVDEVLSLNPACLELGAGKMAALRDAALRLQPYAEIL